VFSGKKTCQGKRILQKQATEIKLQPERRARVRMTVSTIVYVITSAKTGDYDSENFEKMDLREHSDLHFLLWA
jgi:hypothetical protein